MMGLLSRVGSAMSLGDSHIDSVQKKTIFDGGSPLSTEFESFLVQMMVVLCFLRPFTLLLKRCGQPSVIAEMIGGIILGPSLLGLIPNFSDTLFPASSLSYFKLVAEIGLILFMFNLGFETDFKNMAASGKDSLRLSVVALVIPFVTGILMSLALYPSFKPEGGPGHFSAYAVFMATCISITSLSVSGRILTETGALYTRIGYVVLGAATVNDLAAWILLAVGIALAGSGSRVVPLYTLICAIAFVSFLLTCMPPFFTFINDWKSQHKSVRTSEQLTTSLVYVLLFLSAWVTEIIGLDGIFGAFIFGLSLPRDTFVKESVRKLHSFVVNVLLPLYFTVSGLSTNVSSLQGWSDLGILLVIMVVALSTKLVSTFFVTRSFGFTKSEALATGMMMNTRGLTELVILNTARTIGVFDTRVFTVLVLMAVLCTVMVSPLFRRLLRHKRSESVVEAGRAVALSIPAADYGQDIVFSDAITMAFPESVNEIRGLVYLLKAIRRPSGGCQRLIGARFVECGDLIASAVTNEVDSANSAVRCDPESRLAHAPMLGLFTFAAELLEVEEEIVAHIVDRMENRPSDIADAMIEKGVNMAVFPWTYLGSYEDELRVAVRRLPPATTFLYLNVGPGLKMPSVLAGTQPDQVPPICSILALCVHGDVTDERCLGILLPLIKSDRKDVHVTIATLDAVVNGRPIMAAALQRAQRAGQQRHNLNILKAGALEGLKERCRGVSGKPPPTFDLIMFGADGSSPSRLPEPPRRRRSSLPSRTRGVSLQQALLSSSPPPGGGPTEENPSVRYVAQAWRQEFLPSACLVEVNCGMDTSSVAANTTIPSIVPSIVITRVDEGKAD